MRKLMFLVLSAWLGIAGTVFGPTATALADDTTGLKTIMLDVDGMTCNLCPTTVKKALKKVNGVADVTTKYEGDGIGWAKVTYDPAKVKIDDLTFATQEAGYPSRLKP
jgi:mercuric ion binding protein